MIERDKIAILGRVNVGKSTLMNLLTRDETSITDEKPGTTADTSRTVMEFHGLGPTALFDTAGLDEEGSLGEKKKKKVYSLIKESDLILLLIDPSRKDFSTENEIILRVRKEDKPLLLVYNLFADAEENIVTEIEKSISFSRLHKKIIIRANDTSCRRPLEKFILENYTSQVKPPPLLPFLKPDFFYPLIIPLDAESPGNRLLRPQSMILEYILRNGAFAAACRPDLKAIADGIIKDEEERRAEKYFSNLSPVGCVITDSQAIDYAIRVLPEDTSLTTFSIVMINYFSRGRLASFRDGIRSLKKLRKGDKVLIAEACNHTRIEEDIGTVKIPAAISKRFPGVIVEHTFGREFTQTPDLSEYSLIIHCGGCMIDSRKLEARIRDMDAVGVPYTNYGLFLSWMSGDKTLERVLKPWGLELE